MMSGKSLIIAVEDKKIFTNELFTCSSMLKI